MRHLERQNTSRVTLFETFAGSDWLVVHPAGGASQHRCSTAAKQEVNPHVSLSDATVAPANHNKLNIHTDRLGSH